MCWIDSISGELTPDRFIPIAESSGLIIGLGNYVLNASESYQGWLSSKALTASQLELWRSQR